MNAPSCNRILAIDDNRAIHDDYRKILCPAAAGINDAETEFFGEPVSGFALPAFQIDSAYQGAEGVELVEKALASGEPYSLAFVDVRMPPGIDGVETAERLWALCPDLQVVICTAYSDYSWEEMLGRLGHRDRLLVLKKPFTSVEALQIACALSEKWALTRNARLQLADTERVVEERTRELRETDERFRQIAENIEGIFWMATPDLKEALYLSPGCERVLGRSHASLLADPQSWLGNALPDDAENARLFFEVIARGEAAEGEMRVAHQDGSMRWIRNRCFPVRDEAGKVTRVCGIAEDVTARREGDEERRLMEVQLRHSQKMESIGQLAAGIAHEINTPTQYIGDNTRFLQDAFADIQKLLVDYDKLYQAAEAGAVPPELLASVKSAATTADVAYLGEEIPKAIEQSLQGLQRVSKIVGSMKEFSHPGTNEKTAIDLNRSIESTLTVATNEWKYLANLLTDFDATLPPVLCLPGEFNQVVLNMVVNASHAIADVVGDGSKGKGTITVSTRRDGDWVEVRIGDSGTGIPEEIRRKIFDPFFTTKGVGKGTGQGLAIAHSVTVDKHGGTIDLESEVGKGTTFIIRLPINPVSEKKAA